MDPIIIKQLAAEKAAVQKMIQPIAGDPNMNEKELKKLKTELVDVGKFIVTSGLRIEIVEAPYTIPDLLIKWDDQLYAVEHTAVIDTEKKVKAENTDYLIRKAEQHFLKSFGDFPNQVRFSLKFEVTLIRPKEKKNLLQALLVYYGDLGWSREKMMANAHPGYFTSADLESVAQELALNAFQAISEGAEIAGTDYLNYLSVSPSKKLLFTRTSAWSAGSIDQAVLASIAEKEKNIEQYRLNAPGLYQLLFLVVHGSNGYSDYASFDPRILQNRDTPFDKVIFFNFFTGEYFMLK